MRRILRTIGLFAPLLVVVLVAWMVVVAIFYAPVVLWTLAVLTLVLCLVALVAAVVVGSRGAAGVLSRSEASVLGVVEEVVGSPGNARTRRQLAGQLDSFDEIRAVGEGLRPRHRDTLRTVLREVGAAERLRDRADRGGRWERVAAARNIAWLAPPEAGHLLEELARDEDSDVALAGAVGLAALPEAAAFRSLLRLLADGPLPASRIATIMEDTAYPEPLGILEEEVPDGPPPVRFWGAYLAGRTGDPKAFQLLNRLAEDEDPNVRANAAEGIAVLPVAGAFGRLLQLSRDDQWFVRAHAARGLGGQGEAGIERLSELLSDRSWWVRENAASALAAVGDPAVPALRGVLSSDDRFARNKAGEVLVRLGFLEREIETYLEGNGRRGEARENLVLLGRAEVVSSLSSRFLSVEGDRRLELVRVLVEIDDPRLRPTVEALVGGLKPEFPPGGRGLRSGGAGGVAE